MHLKAEMRKQRSDWFQYWTLIASQPHPPTHPSHCSSEIRWVILTLLSIDCLRTRLPWQLACVWWAWSPNPSPLSPSQLLEQSFQYKSRYSSSFQAKKKSGLEFQHFLWKSLPAQEKALINIWHMKLLRLFFFFWSLSVAYVWVI